MSNQRLSLTRQIIAILEARGPTEMELQLRCRPSEIQRNNRRLAKDLVRVGRLANMSDDKILQSVIRHNLGSGERESGEAFNPLTGRHDPLPDLAFERERSLLDYLDGLEEQREETERIADES